MKILYVSQFYYPENAASSFRATDNSKIWVKLGEEVTVFTANPNFPKGKIFEGYSNSLIAEEIINNVRVIRSKIIVKENTTKLKRGICSLSFLFYGLINIIFNKKKIGSNYDIVIGTSGTIFTPIIALVYSRINKVPFVLELRDITYRQMLAVFGNENFMYKFIKKLELSLCKKAKKIIVVTNGYKEQLIKDGIKENKIVVIPNGVIIDDSNYDKKLNKHKNENEFVLSYMGNLGASQELDRVIDFFKSLNLNTVKKKLYFIGDGAKKDELKNYIQLNKIKDVYIVDGIPRKDIEPYYENSDFCIVSLKNNVFFKDTIPSKVFEIMLRRKPILYFGPDGEAANIIKEAKSGLIISNNNPSGFREFISKEIANGNLINIMSEYGTNGYKYVSDYYNRRVLSEKYLNIIGKVRN